MKKLLGKVSVYPDDTEDCISGNCRSSYERVLGPQEYEILLTPKVDRDQLAARGLPYDAAKNTATTLAHEFGHLIGRLLKSPMQLQRMSSEREAWALADIQYPDLDKAEERLALGMYEETYGSN